VALWRPASLPNCRAPCATSFTNRFQKLDLKLNVLAETGAPCCVVGAACASLFAPLQAASERLVLRAGTRTDFYAREQESEQARHQQQQQGEGKSQGLGECSPVGSRSGMGVTPKRSEDVAAAKFREIMEAY